MNLVNTIGIMKKLAELMTGQQPFTDPSPYSVQRFL